jgi:hypothetical protein
VVVDLTDASDPGVSASLLGEIDMAWNDCEILAEMLEDLRRTAGVVCQEGVACTMPPSSPSRVVFVEGDFVLNDTGPGEGLLVVTGTLTMDGNASWDGILLVVGEGVFIRNGAGNGVITGATLLADIAGPDNVYGTADDCTGGENGFDSVVYDESGGGTSDTVFCSNVISPATPVTHFPIIEFRQR